MLQKNELIEIEITGYTTDGSGVGHAPDGMAVFVPGAAQGDRLQVRILKNTGRLAYGKIERILAPSADRTEPDCPQYPKCGGCVFRHITYEAELRAKEQRVRDAVERIGGFSDLCIRPIVGAPSPDGYRNKAQLPICTAKDGTLQMGFYARHSHRVIDCDSCRLQPPVFEKAMRSVRFWAEQSGVAPYDEATHRGILRHVYLRIAQASGEVMVCLVANGARLPQEETLVSLLRAQVPGLAGVVLNENRAKTNVILGNRCRLLWGKEAITDTLCGLQFEISPLSFYQVNRGQAQRLYEIAAQYAGLTGREHLLDLYCGTGTIGLTMARRAKRLTGVEIVPQAVEDAKENARRNGITNARFYCADAAQAARELRQKGEMPDVVVLDPPRKGCDEALVHTVCGMEPARVVYVSCDPATLARDMKRFNALGYRPQELTPVDMFPRTAHVETVVLLQRESL